MRGMISVCGRVRIVIAPTYRMERVRSKSAHDRKSPPADAARARRILVAAARALAATCRAYSGAPNRLLADCVERARLARPAPTLPDELWLAIFAYLPWVGDLCRVRRVCRRWAALGSDHLLWERYVTAPNYSLSEVTTRCYPIGRDHCWACNLSLRAKAECGAYFFDSSESDDSDDDNECVSGRSDGRYRIYITRVPRAKRRRFMDLLLVHAVIDYIILNKERHYRSARVLLHAGASLTRALAIPEFTWAYARTSYVARYPKFFALVRAEHVPRGLFAPALRRTMTERYWSAELAASFVRETASGLGMPADTPIEQILSLDGNARAARLALATSIAMERDPRKDYFFMAWMVWRSH